MKTKHAFSLAGLLLGGVLFLLSACRHESDLAGLPDMSFSADIQPILASNCSMQACHGNDRSSKFPLLTYNDVIEEGKVEAGKAERSDLYRAIVRLGSNRMPRPPRSALSDNDIKKIYIWIRQGAKNN